MNSTGSTTQNPLPLRVFLASPGDVADERALALRVLEELPYDPRRREGGAKAKGVKFGRKPKLSPAQIKHARQQIERGRRVPEVAALLNVDRATLYRALRGWTAIDHDF